MKKSTIIMIAIVYIASIVFISLFGMRAIIFEEVIPVTKVECINVSDERVTVTESNGSKVLNIPFTEPGTLDDNGSPQGTFVYINVRVYPDNATNQNIIFVYNEDSAVGVDFIKGTEGNELRVLLFENPISFPLTIKAADGSNVSELIWISVR